MGSTVDLPGESAAIVAIRAQVARLLERQSGSRPLPPILIQGETGTGKGLLARLIHRAGTRAAGPYVDVNCAGIPETLLEAEMFGFERGAFTDARQAKAGLFQAAHHGTLFLDEIGELAGSLQAKLLKVIEERTVRRLGSTRTEPVDVSLIAATNEDLAAAVRERRFREDLFHRLAVLTLWLPPLRERGRDVVLLADRFLAQACADYQVAQKRLSPDAQAALLAHPWKGNVRELANTIERAVLSADPARSREAVLTAEDFGLPHATPSEAPPGPAPRLEPAPDAREGVEEREWLRAALERNDWNISQTAAELHMTRNTLRYRIEKHGLTPPVIRRTPERTPALPARAVEPPRSAPPSWEPRRVTLLRLLVAPAPGPAPARWLPIVVEKVESFGGRVEERSATGVTAVFGLDPLEGAAAHAAHAAMALQRAAERAQRDGDPVRVQAGIATNVLPVGTVDGAIRIEGEARRRAGAALDALLAGGERDGILATEGAAAALHRRFELAPLEAGASGEPAHRLMGRHGRAPGRGGIPAPFVGRQPDLDLLRSRLVSAHAGRGQLVGIVGEAGLGKSRLVAEFLRTLRDEPITSLEGRSVPYGRSQPYLPIRDVLRQRFGISDFQGAAAVVEQVHGDLRQIEMDAAEWAPYLLQVLGVQGGTERLAALSPDAVKTRTLEAIRQLALRSSRQRPIVLVLEDLQWQDSASEECVSWLVDGLAGAAILLIATYRPGYRPPWMDRSYATQIALQPLAEDDSRSVMRSALGGAAVPDRLARLVLDRAEGNPFFLEELSGALREEETLAASLDVPDTIQDVLLARIHRLPDRARQTLQAAALLGRECTPSLLRLLASEPAELERDLHDLMRLEFLYQRSSGAEPVYVFKHTLTQEVAYGSLPAPRRPALHAAAGRALETIHADRLPEVYEALAHQYERSDRADKALEYLELLGQKAASLHAHEEAARAFRDAQRHLHALPADRQGRRRLHLLLRQGAELIPLGRLRDVLELLDPERETVERLDDPALSAQYHFVLSYMYAFLDRARSVRSAERAIAEADRCGDAATKGKAYCLLGQDGPFSGRALEGIEHGRKALDLLAGRGEDWWFGRAHWVIALNHAQLGAFGEALRALAPAAALAESTGDPRLQVATAWCAGVVHASRGEADAGIDACHRAVESARDPLNRAIANGWLGYALMEKGDAGGAVARLEGAVAEFERFGYRTLQAWFAAFLAEAHRLDAKIEEARRIAQQSLQIAGEADVPPAASWARLVLGRIAIDIGAYREAEDCLREALAGFAATHSRYETGRAQMDLAIAVHAQGRKDEARGNLDAAYRLFTALDLPARADRARHLARDLLIPL